jgi:hypothetical protein
MGQGKANLIKPGAFKPQTNKLRRLLLFSAHVMNGLPLIMAPPLYFYKHPIFSLTDVLSLIDEFFSAGESRYPRLP